MNPIPRDMLDALELRDDFDQVHGRGMWAHRLARLGRRSSGLLSYQDALRQLDVIGERHLGIQAVSIDRIVGSTERWADFDAAFRPLRDASARRWRNVARAYDAGEALPPVHLYRIADTYYVRDGHHRISVARLRGQVCIDADVVEVLVSAWYPAARVAHPKVGVGVTGADRPPLHGLADGMLAGIMRRARMVRAPRRVPS
jgi:hypothetical protein